MSNKVATYRAGAPSFNSLNSPSDLHGLRQISIVHLSDLHFGNPHRFNPPRGPDGGALPRDGYPTLAELLHRDWTNKHADDAVIVCITGDVTETASGSEFTQAHHFVHELVAKPIMGSPTGLDRIFVVPGNHDVEYTKIDNRERWAQYAIFYQGLFNHPVNPDKPKEFSRVHDRSKDLNLIILELNSCTWVQKGTNEADRGQLDVGTIGDIEAKLDAIDKESLRSSIKVALIHHHPILLPIFVESGRNYDSVINGDYLLRLLRKYGFHLLLHGHKHDPYVFSFDAQSAVKPKQDHSTIVVAGGSAGSRGLPDRRPNTYNIITIKWNPDALEARVRVETRGLVVDEDGEELNPSRWRWDERQVNERRIARGGVPTAANVHAISFNSSLDAPFENLRKNEYARLKGNLPVVHVVPSMTASQAYEAHLWLEQHNNATMPSRVIWSAGPFFTNLQSTDAPKFKAMYEYYGPMLVQARIHFADGAGGETCEIAHIYAHLPR